MFKKAFLQYIEDNNIPQDDVAGALNITQQAVSQFLTREGGVRKATIEKIFNAFPKFESYFKQYKNNENKESHIVLENKSTYDYPTKEDGTPYFDIDFTLSFLEVENTHQIQPDYYVTHPFFKGCDFIVRASGQSMAKVIKHGDAIGLVKIDGWQDFIPMGEIYAIVTKNGFRMIKVITKGDTKDSYTLISKPTDNKKDEFPPQQISKSQILTIYKVQASSHLF